MFWRKMLWVIKVCCYNSIIIVRPYALSGIKKAKCDKNVNVEGIDAGSTMKDKINTEMVKLSRLK